MTKTFTITLEDFTVALGDTGLVTKVEVSKFPESAIKFAAMNGFISALNNISRGKDDNGKANSDDVWASARAKRCLPWVDGNWGSVTRESNVAPLKEAYIDETRERTKQSVADVEKDMTKLVRDTFGEKEKATFGRFLDALATQIAKARKLDTDEVRGKLEAKYARLAKEAADARAEATDGLKLDLSAISLD
jgi:hypothetical protein